MAFRMFFWFSIEPDQVANLIASFDSNGTIYNTANRMYTLDVNIVWNSPVYPNGDIISYEVIVSQTENSSNVLYSNDSLLVLNVTESVMVLPFTNYTVSVAASTSAGQGDNATVIILSPEAG